MCMIRGKCACFRVKMVYIPGHLPPLKEDLEMQDMIVSVKIHASVRRLFCVFLELGLAHPLSSQKARSAWIFFLFTSSVKKREGCVSYCPHQGRRSRLGLQHRRRQSGWPVHAKVA